MATDILVLGGVVFTDFSPPERMCFGGRHALAVHKLIGGQRVIDALGPDDHDVSWSGKFYGNNALSECLLLDSMRAAGTALPLVWGAQALVVVISEFESGAIRFPQYIDYSITCVISTNGALGFLGTLTLGADSLVGADLAGAQSLIG